MFTQSPPSIGLASLLTELEAIPAAESLARALARAVDVACDGDAPEGYELLLLRRHRLRCAPCEDAALCGEVLAVWQYALDRFAAEFGIARG